MEGGNRIELLESRDQEEQWVPKDVDYFIKKKIMEENIRKEKWVGLHEEKTGKKMTTYMEKIRRQKEKNSNNEGTEASSYITQPKG